MELIAKTELTMTSREIADLVESRHDNVRTTIDRLVKRGVIRSPAMQDFKNASGATGKEYLVGKRDSLVIVAQLSPEFTARIVDRWQELEEQIQADQIHAIPKTLSSALRLAAEQAEVIERQQAELAAAAPKIEFADAVRHVDGLCSFEQIAKALGIGRNTLIARLKEDEVLQDNRMPYQRYIDRGYFQVIEQRPWADSQGNTHPSFTTRVTGAGQVWLAKRFAQPQQALFH